MISISIDTKWTKNEFFFIDYNTLAPAIEIARKTVRKKPFNAKKIPSKHFIWFPFHSHANFHIYAFFIPVFTRSSIFRCGWFCCCSRSKCHAIFFFWQSISIENEIMYEWAFFLICVCTCVSIDIWYAHTHTHTFVRIVCMYIEFGVVFLSPLLDFYLLFYFILAVPQQYGWRYYIKVSFSHFFFYRVSLFIFLLLRHHVSVFIYLFIFPLYLCLFLPSFSDTNTVICIHLSIIFIFFLFFLTFRFGRRCGFQLYLDYVWVVY